ncbi:glycosyltransferase [Oleiharenicola lentus]|uniref:glycosyltransferase n=1 Tax=Oleiharenicola lentus TaxID=2508720 RepID=UPI003F66B59C
MLIAAYHAAPTLAKAIASVQAQTYQDWEIIVVEDGSHDGTEALVRAIALFGPQSIRYENLGVNQGVAAARNRLRALAKGDAFAFLDADDWWSPNHLQLGAAQLTQGAGLVVMGVRMFALETGESLGDVHAPDSLVNDPIGTLFEESHIVTSSCVIFSRATSAKVGAFDLRFRIGEDRDYWLRAALNNVRFARESIVSCHYAKHATSTMSRTSLVATQAVMFYEKYSDLTGILGRARNRQLAHSLIQAGRLLRASDPAASAAHIRRAWKLTPGNLTVMPHFAYSKLHEWFETRPSQVLLVADQLGGQCSYSGIHQLGRFLKDERAVRVIGTPDTRARRIIGKLWSLLRRWPVRNQSLAYTELETGWALATSSLSAVHFLVGENHAPYLAESRGKQPVIATLHMPASTFNTPPPKSGRVHTLVLLTARDRKFFAGAWGSQQIVVIPHGVDTTFFHPGNAVDLTPPSILVVGRFLRDFQLTAATVMKLAAAHPTWRFDFVVPAASWHGAELAPVRALPGAHWHDRINDEQLRALYQGAHCHLTPFADCTANNALVESLACGLPIVTTDRGGVRDYGAGSVYPLAEADSAAALAALCERYIFEPHWRARIAASCRHFAVETLSWPVIARHHLTLYSQVTHAA